MDRANGVRIEHGRECGHGVTQSINSLDLGTAGGYPVKNRLRGHAQPRLDVAAVLRLKEGRYCCSLLQHSANFPLPGISILAEYAVAKLHVP